MDVKIGEQLQLPLNVHTTCGYCGHVMSQADAIVGIIKAGSITHEDTFCCFECRNAWRARITRPVW